MTNKSLFLVLFILIFFGKHLLSQNYGVSNYRNIRHSNGFSYLENMSLMNPASISFDTSNYISIGIKPSRFGISELNPAQANAMVKLDSAFSLGMIITGIGGELYSEISGETRISYKVNNIIFVGSSVEFNRLFIKNYNSESLLMLNIGTNIILSKDFTAGFYLRNLLRNHSVQSDRSTYQELCFGVSYQIDENSFADMDANIIINSISALNIGLKHYFNPNFAMRLGLKTNPGIIEIGTLFNLYQSVSMLTVLEFNKIFGISSEIGFRFGI